MCQLYGLSYVFVRCLFCGKGATNRGSPCLQHVASFFQCSPSMSMLATPCALASANTRATDS